MLDALDVTKLECIYKGLVKSLVDVDNYGLKCNTDSITIDLQTASLYNFAVNISPTICRSLECKILDFIESKATYSLNYPDTCTEDTTTNTTLTATITCPSTINADTSGNPTVVVTYTTPTYTTSCPVGAVLSRTSGPASGTALAAGTYTVTYNLIDDCGTDIDCSFTINVTTSV
jgi:hypothetical protein